MDFKRAEDKDIPEMANLMLEEFSKPPYDEVAFFEDVIKSLGFYLDIGDAFIAVDEGELVGVLVFKEEVWWAGRVFIIEDLAVKNSEKKKGIAKALLKQLERLALNSDIKSIVLSTHAKSPAIGFYEKMGFTIKDKVFLGRNIKD